MAKFFQPALEAWTHMDLEDIMDIHDKMQNDSLEDIFLEQDDRRMEQIVTICHGFIIRRNRLDEIWKDEMHCV